MKKTIKIEYLLSEEGGSNGEEAEFFLTTDGTIVSVIKEPYPDDEAIVELFGDQIEALSVAERKKLLENTCITETDFKKLNNYRTGVKDGDE